MASDFQIPGYTILGDLGKGGMSVVYLAEQLNFSRKVALKIMPVELAKNENFGHRFLREARIAANLSHPNIVSVYDTGVNNGSYFLAMEYLTGGDLRTALQSGIALTEGLDIIETLAETIHYAASKGIVHRDIKPSNIMFREDGSLAMVDFGIARDLSTDTMVTQVGAIMGTPHYMSPEQCAGKELDCRSDIYSLGVVLHEILTGRVPFTGDSAVAIGIKHISGELPLVTGELEIFQQVIDKSLAKDVDDRYQSGREMANDLADLREELPADLGATILLTKESASSLSRHSLRSRSLSHSSKMSKIRVSSQSHARPKATSRHGSSLKLWGVIATGLSLVSLGIYSQRTNLGIFFDTGSTQVLPSIENRSAAIEAKNTSIEPLKAPNPNVESRAIEYLAKASDAINHRAYEQARQSLNLAIALNPQSGEAKVLQSQTEEALSKGEAKQQLLGNLFVKMEGQIENGNIYSPSKNNAYESLKDISAIDIENSRIPDFKDTLDRLSSQKISALLSRGEISTAGNELKRWRSFASVQAIRPVSDKYNSLLKKRQDHSKRIKGLLADASRLEELGLDQELYNHKLLSIYNQVLAIDPGNSVAKREIDKSAIFELESAYRALELGDFSAASESISTLKAQVSDLPGLSELDLQLSRRQALRSSAVKTLNRALELLKGVRDSENSTSSSSPEMSNLLAKDLISAHQLVSRAGQEDPTVPRLKSTYQNIESEYLSRFEIQIKSENYEAAEIYLKALENTSLPTPGAKDMERKMVATWQGIPKKRTRPFSSF